MEFVASFSGGKDSSMSIIKMIERGHRLLAIIVSTKEDKGISWTHDLDKNYFEKAADIFRCEVIFTDTDVKNYEKQFERALLESKKMGASACVFGDIDISDHLSWNKNRCDSVSMECIHPLMFEKREKVVELFLKSSLKAKIKKVDENKISKEFIGKDFDKEFVKKIKEIDICGESGEFHTVVDLESIRRALGAGIYVDNASTCFPKAPGVATRLSDFISTESYSINRGTYMKAYNLSSQVIDVRDKLTKLLKAPKGYSTIFSSSATESINMILRGILSKGDEVIVDDRMHNSSWRTLEHLNNNGIEINLWSGNNRKNKNIFDTKEDIKEGNQKCEGIDTYSLEKIYKNNNSKQRANTKYNIIEFEKSITDKTKVVFLTLVDNVMGYYMEEAEEIGKICEQRNIYYIIDGVQSICEREVSLEKLKADAFIVSGHIGLMGPEGIAATIIKNEFAREIKPLIYGGTGSQSNSPCMPDTLPDKLEAGTIATPAIIALGTAIDYIEKIGIDKIIEKKHRLGKKLRNELEKIDGVEVSGNGSFCSLSMKEYDDAMTTFNIDARKNIMARVGIQCSPCTHIVEDSFPNGSIRFSLGYFNNEYDIEEIIDAIRHEQLNF